MENKIIDNATLVKAIIEGIQEKKGKSIVHVDMSDIEYAATQGFVICNGTSSMRVEAIADSIREYVEEKIEVRPYNFDGYQNGEWIVIDYGTIYAHVFMPEIRERYRLEELWSDAKVVEIPDLD